MEKSLVNYSRSARGLTLIEVLIALAIVGIALTAIIKATGQTIRGTSYLQNKTIALWVGQEVVNEARVHLIKLPNAPDRYKKEVMMLGQTWFVTADQEDTSNDHIKLLKVKVFSNDEDEESSVITLESYLYHDT